MSNPEYQALLDHLGKYGKAAVAFSGGTDSTFLLAAAVEAYKNDVLAITVNTPYTPSGDLEDTRHIAAMLGARHRVLTLTVPPEIRENPENRCYLCKKHLFTNITEVAAGEGFTVVFDGTNADDPSDHRPGLRALEELKVVSPLRETGLGKEHIRKMARSMNLPNWDKPANACLLTRLPFGTPADPELLKKIDRAETFLHELGFRNVRLRVHHRIARLELPRELIPVVIRPEYTGRIIPYLKTLGFDFITLDLEGYRTGSFNQKQKE